jgi:PAS domain-containing protein
MANLAADLDDRLRALEHELEQLAADRQRYADLFAFSPEASLVTDVHGTILDANLAADRLLHGGGELRGKALDGFVPLEQRRVFFATVSAAIQGIGSARFPAKLRLAAGDIEVSFSMNEIRRARAPVRLAWTVRPCHEAPDCAGC